MNTLATSLLILSLVFISLQDAVANGWLYESSALKSGHAVIKQGVDLISEKVSILLKEKDYTITITYNLQTDRAPFSGTLFFPILCKDVQYQTITTPCVSDYRVKVNDKEITSIKESGAALADFETPFKTRIYDPAIIKKHLRAHDVLDHDVNEGAQVLVMSSLIRAEAPDFNVTITYRQPYYFIEYGTTKSSIYTYSDNIVYYDFSPAASWAKNKLSNLQVMIDATQTVGTVSFPKYWNFKNLGRTFTAERTDIRLADTPNLLISIDNKHFQQYRDHKSTLNFADVTYSLSSNDTLFSKTGSYDVQKAMDGDTSTAWCSNAEQPELIMTIKRGPKGKGLGCGFEGFGIINGYTKSAGILKANRRIRSGTIEIDGSGNGKFALKDADTSSEFDPYASLRFINSDDHGSFSIIAAMEKSWKNVDDDTTTVNIKITGVYEGERHKDVCIAEIYPFINCY